MKIVSRPQDDDTGGASVIGTGQHTLQVTDAQLELIAALLYQCRLGMGTIYSTAAFELNEIIEDTFGSDFMEDAGHAVDLQVTMEDDTGSVVFSSKSGTYYPTFEV